MIIWFTGLSGAGKSTICRAAERALRAQGRAAEVLDGDEVRQYLSDGLGYSKQDRIKNLWRIHYVAQLLSRNGVIVLVATISPYRDVRVQIRKASVSTFLEVYVCAPLAVCEQRDPKGLYQRARQGLISSFTGISDPFEPPLTPDIICHTQFESVTASCAKVLAGIQTRLATLPSRSQSEMARSQDALLPVAAAT